MGWIWGNNHQYIQKDDNDKRSIEEAIKWFVLSFIAAIIPFIKEISLFGYGLKLLDELQRTNEKIDALESIINSQKTGSREYHLGIDLVALTHEGDYWAIQAML